MKRSLLILLTLVMLLSFTACVKTPKAPVLGGNKEELPDENYEFTPPSENPISDVTGAAWVTHSFDKIAANGAVPASLSTEYRVYMTRGETEGCQIAFRTDSNNELTLKCTYKEENSFDYEIFILDVNYDIKGELLPDPAVPYAEGASFTVQAGNTLPFIIEFETLRDTKAGYYPFVFELRDGEDKTVAQYTLIVRVWAITLPEKRTYQTSVVISEKDIATYYFGSGTEVDDEVYVNYCDMLLEHNMSPQTLPYDVLDPRADAYMSDPRVTSFKLPHNVSDETLKAYYNKLKTNPKWLNKAYFLPFGECDTIEEIVRFCEISLHLQEICPGIKITSPLSVDIQVDVLWDQINAMKGYCTLWCPKLCLWDDEVSYGNHDYVHSMTFEARMRKMMKEGYGVWTYFSYTPSTPYTGFFVNHSGLHQRLLFWQQYQRGIHGIIYWSTTAWNIFYQVDPWETVFTGLYDNNNDPVYGDGILFYPGKNITDTPTVSQRMKIMRDGIDDIELLILAGKTLGSKWINDRVNSLSSALTSIEADEEAFTKIRIEIGNALEKALD